MLRAYQPIGAVSGRPESLEPQGKGTVMESGKAAAPFCHVWVSPSSLPSKRNCHWPFRFTQAGRWKSGRGCSGSGISCCAWAAPERSRVTARAADTVRWDFIGFPSSIAHYGRGCPVAGPRGSHTAISPTPRCDHA